MTRTSIVAALLSFQASALIAAPASAESELIWAEPIEVATGGGYKGPWRMNRSRFEYVDDPTVAINDRGIIGVAFADLSRQDIFFQAYDPEGGELMEAPVNVSKNSSIFSWLPRIAISNSDPMRVFVLWQEIVFSGGSHGGEIFFARSADGGRSFTAPVNLSNSEPGDGKGRLSQRYWDNGSLDLALGRDGALYAAWTEYEGTLWFRRSDDGGRSFSAPVQLVKGGIKAPARGPALAAGPEDNVYIAWAVGEDPAADIQVARSADRGRSFSQPVAVGRTKGHADAPKIAVDAEGTVHLVFAESPDGPWQSYHVLYARSTDGGATFDKPRLISESDSDRYASLNFPALSLGPGKRAYVMFELFPKQGHRPRGLGLTLTEDGGKSFEPYSEVPGSAGPENGFNGSQQGLLMRKLAVNSAGAIAVVNSTFVPGQSSHVWLIRGRHAP